MTQTSAKRRCCAPLLEAAAGAAAAAREQRRLATIPSESDAEGTTEASEQTETAPLHLAVAPFFTDNIEELLGRSAKIPGRG